MGDFLGWSCLAGVAAAVGLVGLFFLLFSPRVSIPFWLFASFSICMAAGLAAFLGFALDVIFRNSTPVLTAVGAVGGAVAGGTYTISIYRTRSPAGEEKSNHLSM